MTVGKSVARTPARVVDPDFYRYERYLSTSSRSRLLSLYYALKPLVPRRLQLALRRAYVGRQEAQEFPGWPEERTLVDAFYQQLFETAHAEGEDSIPFVPLWPDRRQFACVLTHDVEGPSGVENIARVLEVERRHGFVSSWNFVAEWYPIPPDTFERIREAGCEVGLHGVKHDGKLFRSRARFAAELPKIHAYLRDWNVEGFRSPATGRNAEWMHELACSYDSSFPDSDPFEPQPGGCCSIWPFFFGSVVELPITLVQDHTLFEILREPSNELWERKARFLMQHHGLINLITHPDYLVSDENLGRYEAFLEFLAAHRAEGWFALPQDVARWWRSRAAIRCVSDEAGVRLEGFIGNRAKVAWARIGSGGVVIEA